MQILLWFNRKYFI